MILKVEYIFDITVILFRPDMMVIDGVDQLYSYAKTLSGASNAAFQNISYAQFLGHLLRFYGLVFVSPAGIPRDHEHTGQFGQISDQVFRHPISEISLFRITAEIFEGQYGYGWFVW